MSEKVGAGWPDGASRRPGQIVGERAGNDGAVAQDGAQRRPRRGEVAGAESAPAFATLKREQRLVWAFDFVLGL